MLAALLAVALGAAALPGFPREAGGRIGRAAVALELGGAPAVIVAAGDRLAAFRADGAPVPGFPLVMDGDAAGAPAASDLDGDGRPELAAVTAGGTLWVWSGGAPAPGFPARLGAPARAGPSFADVDGDGRPEVLAGDVAGRIHAFRRGGVAARGFPADVGRPITTSVSSSSFGGALALAAGCEDGRVVVLDGAGRPRRGFPLVTGFTVSGAPAFADLDGDGAVDLVAASQDFQVHAVDARGERLAGFPVSAGYRLYEGPALADLDGDGGLDVVFASADGAVHAVSGRGRPLPGFPAQAGARTFGGPAVADLDRDGRLDVVVVGADGTVHALDGGGRPLPGFPAALGAPETTASPLLHDLPRAGAPAVLVGVASGRLHALRPPPPARVQAEAPTPWPQAGRDAARTGRFGPNPPVYRDLALAPEAPRTGDGLRASWKGLWLDGRPGEEPPPPRIGWRRDGRPVPAHDGRRELPPGAARKGETWRFVLAAPGGRTFEGPERRILDSPPGAPTLALAPAAPSRAEPVRAVVAVPASDADGDRLTYRFRWLLDGAEVGAGGDTLPPERLVKGALLEVTAVASDGEAEGPPARAAARVVDVPPGAPEVALEPAAPGRGGPVRVRVVRPPADLDGDPLVLRHAWRVGGEPRNLPASAAELPAGAFAKHQAVEVEVRAFDGEREGPPAVARVTAVNTPPGAPAVAIAPPAPRRGEALRAVLTAPAADVDGDALVYRFAWRKNGRPLAVPGDAREVPGAEVARGDRFEVSVVALDGEAEGPPASAAVTAGNTAPEPPRIVVEPARPRGGEPLRLRVVEPARDVDGDPVSLGVAWAREGRPAGEGGERLEPAAFRKGERVRVTVTPADGAAAGEPALFEVAVENAPPGAPAVALAPAQPTVTAALRAVLSAPAADADGDPLRHRWRWLRDGAPVAVPDGGEDSRRPPYWTSATEVPARELRKGQRWTVEAQAFDGEAHGPVERASATIANAPPPSPEVALRPAAARRQDGLVVELRQPADPDGDPLTHRYAWTRNGARVDVPPGQGQIPRGLPRQGERWAVEVVAQDGEAESAPARAEVVIAGTPPGPAELALCDGPVPTGTAPEVRVTAPAADADGDPVSYRIAWTVSGRPVPGADGRTRLPVAPGKHDVVRVAVTPWDGALAGPAVAAECTFRNTPPSAPAVALEPAEPTAATGLRVVVRRPSADRDGDPVTYRHAWTRDGLPAPFDGPGVPPGAVRHREVWRVVVTPWDGEEEGEAIALAVTVRNTPPPAPAVTLTPPAPAAGEPVACDARAPERDADGEPLALRHRWYRDGVAQAVGEGSAVLPRGLVRRGERWRCEAWADDGAGGEGPRGTAEVLVRNSPPAAPAVAIEPARPRRGDALACRVAGAAADPDGDAVRYEYAWTRDGRAVAAGGDAARVPAGAVRRGERWRCEATPSDGALAGPPGAAEVVVANTPPGPPRVRLAPAEPRPGQALVCELDAPAADVDGDGVRYRFRWLRNGLVQPFAETSREVPARLVRGGDRWRCAVTPEDGTEAGPEARSEEVAVPAASTPGP